MSKKSLYIVIACLAVGLLYLLFMPTDKVAAPAHEDVPGVPAATTTGSEVPASAETVPATASTTSIEGLFVSLSEAENEFQKEFYYLMLDDGTEVVRIDLRPLLGYSTIDPIGKLGVDRGSRVVVTGTMSAEGFVVTAIAPLP